VAALEGAPELTSCEAPLVLKAGGCEVQPMCPIRSPIHRVRERLWRMLEHTTLRSLQSGAGLADPTLDFEPDGVLAAGHASHGRPIA
jgi:hypothetical protein